MKSRQPARAGALSLAWGGLISARLTVILLIGIIALSVLGTVIAQQGTSATPLERLYSPDLLYFMRMAGLTDIFHSGWFISVLILLSLNLFCGAVAELPSAWRQALQRIPGAINVGHIVNAKRQEKYLHADFKSGIGREQFRELVSAWTRRRVGKAHAVRDEGGLNELQLVAQEGRFTRVSLYFAQLSLLVIIAGAMIGTYRGFEGQVTVDEGNKVGFIQVLKGSHQNWPLLHESGRAIPGFYVPGFEIECERIDVDLYPRSERPRSVRSTLNFFEDGKLVATREIGINHPARFKGMVFHQSSYSLTGQQTASLIVSDRTTEVEQRAESLSPGSSYMLPGASLKVLDIQDQVEGFGPAAQLEYTEGEGKPERFWIFSNYPKFDPVHRKHSRYTFMLESLRPRYGTVITVTRDPGAPVVWAGCALLLLTLVSALMYSHNRFWFVWTPGHVTVVGWSNKPVLFEPKFERAMNQFKNRLSRIDRSLKAAET